MTISLVVAMTRQRVMGKNNQLPWHLPGDLKRFKEITSGHPIIMGRKTFDSIGRPLPKRTNIVITRDPSKLPETVVGASSLDEALAKAESDANGEIFVIGGSEIFRMALPRADKLYLTWIEPPFDGDIVFPDFDLRDFKCVREEAIEEPFPHVFADYERLR